MTESSLAPRHQEPAALTMSTSLLRGLNYEMHLINHGLGEFARAHPWAGGPLALIGATVAWSLYWVLFPPLALVTFTIWFVVRVGRALKT